jgi:hypothetical protein
VFGSVESDDDATEHSSNAGTRTLYVRPHG